jgi:hypothetical protein
VLQAKAVELWAARSTRRESQEGELTSPRGCFSLFWRALTGFFFSIEISEISPETGILATLRENTIPFKKIRFDLNLNSILRSNKLLIIHGAC